MRKAWAVYIVTNVMNGKQYVGLTKSLEKRWDAHRRSNGSAPALHAAIKKYGGLSTYRKLNAVAVYTKRTSPAASKTFKADRNYVGRKLGYKST